MGGCGIMEAGLPWLTSSSAYKALLGEVFWSLWVGQGETRQGTRKGAWGLMKLEESESDANEIEC